MINEKEQLRMAEDALLKNGFKKVDDVWVAAQAQPVADAAPVEAKPVDADSLARFVASLAAKPAE